MRSVSPELRARLDAEATTFCHCWKLLRRDGQMRGFTDHDRDLVIDGVTYESAVGFEASRGESAIGFAAGGAEIDGVFIADGPKESDLSAGLYDGASVETWLVDWSDPSQCLLLSIDSIGEVRRSENAFTAELRSLAHELDQERGRLYQTACSADLGDARCGMQLALLRASGTVVAIRDDGAIVVDIGLYPDDWFSGGVCAFTSGENAGHAFAIRLHRADDAKAVLTPWIAPARTVGIGDAATLTAGCDKLAATCRAKFDNFVNFRGFPHIPGDDVLFAYANSSDAKLDGGSLFR